MLSLAAMLLALTLPAHAGTVANPEVTDPAGDAIAPGIHGVNADWADITGVWFTTVRGSGGEVTGFDVHVSTLDDAEAPEQDARYSVSWLVNETCNATVTMSRTDWGDGWGSPGAWVTYGCEADGETIAVGGHPVFTRVPGSMAVGLGFEDRGTEIIAHVRLDAFWQGMSAGTYGPGTTIEHVYANSTTMLNAIDGEELAYGLSHADETGCNLTHIGRTCEQSKPFVIGS